MLPLDNRPRWFLSPLFVAAMVVQTLTLGGLAYTVPKFTRLFDRLYPGEPLPGLLDFLLSVRPGVFLLVLVVVLTVLTAKECLLEGSTVALGLNLFSLVLCAVVVGLYVLGLALVAVAQGHGLLG